MSCYQSLPLEIRQHILRLVMLEDGLFLKPQSGYLSSLILVNRQTFKDVKSILSVQNAIYLFERPSFKPWPAMSRCESGYSLPVPTSVCLSLFDAAKIETMTNSYEWSFLSHCDLLSEWKSKMSQMLPKHTKRVLLDATPVPAYIRKGGPDWIASMVHDTRIRRYFMEMPMRYLLAAIRAIPPSCAGDIDIVLTGAYGRQYRFWLDQLVSECCADGIHLSLDVEYLAKLSPTLKPQPIAVAVNRLEPPRSNMDPDEHLRWMIACVRMQITKWSQPSQDLYKSCAIVSNSQTVDLMQAVLRFEAEQHLQTLDLPPSEVLQRAFVHQVCGDLGWCSESVGEEPDRFVRLSRNSLVRR